MKDEGRLDIDIYQFLGAVASLASTFVVEVSIGFRLSKMHTPDLFVCLSVCLFVCLCVCVFVCLFVCVCVYVSASCGMHTVM